jgi:hypothetical protein
MPFGTQTSSYIFDGHPGLFLQWGLVSAKMKGGGRTGLVPRAVSSPPPFPAHADESCSLTTSSQFNITGFHVLVFLTNTGLPKWL